MHSRRKQSVVIGEYAALTSWMCYYGILSNLLINVRSLLPIIVHMPIFIQGQKELKIWTSKVRLQINVHVIG